MAFELFISYSHADEWLKNELVKHFAALVRNKIVDVWHDRRIPPGGKIDARIDDHVRSADLFLFLISNDFINSDYCFHKEYEIALERQKRGEVEIVPIIVRACDWDVGGLRTFKALPTDGVPVTRQAVSKDDAQERDVAWTDVITGIKETIKELKKKLTPPTLSSEYTDGLFLIDNIRHPLIQRIDERSIFVDPNVYYENSGEQVTKFQEFVYAIEQKTSVIITGGDRSGKSLISKLLQVSLDKISNPSVLIKGKDIRTSGIAKFIDQTLLKQYGSVTVNRSLFTIIIDDFDECNLSDGVKEEIVSYISKNFKRVVILSFSNASTVLFTSNELPDPQIFKLNPLTDDKLLTLSKRWKSLGLKPGCELDDREVLMVFERLQLVLNQTELEKYAYTAVTFLELIESFSGTDISVSSFASCYDTLITTRLQKVGTDWRSFDEAKNFLSLVAYRSFVETGTRSFGKEIMDDCLDIFETQYLSSPKKLRSMAFSSFVVRDDDNFEFREEYLWYFLCARYVAKALRQNDAEKYREFVSMCTTSIFQKKFANIVIFIAYFSDDNFVVKSLVETLDGLFSKADSWILSDRTREIMLGISPEGGHFISSKSDVSENRADLVREHVLDVISSAEKVVARYTLPFLNSNIGDSELIHKIDDREIDSDSYMHSVNALLRIHSVLGQILSTRAGTYSAPVILECITKMVQASGRYASLNHAIATVLMYDGERAREEVRHAYAADHLSNDERYEKVKRIFAFWSVYVSQAGLARYLNQPHSIRALEKLVEKFESEANADEEGNIPFNFSSVLVIARLYATGRMNKSDLDDVIKKYGKTSAFLGILRATFNIYSMYMPLDIQDKQWISNKLGIPLRRVELQKFKATDVGGRLISVVKRGARN
ncbi:TIR domain-containing protein [Mesorhizobium sp. Cs1299R1N3]|uniref:TIR domain-containing protein n=1 Tax=Mesorhizobium sp. Cs1299R1N3 TaxID=3015173 RepID=UPI00301BD7CC